MFKEITQKKITWHLSVLVLSVVTFMSVLAILLQFGSISTDTFGQKKFKNFYPTFTYEAYLAMRNQLYHGDIVMFGSSELSSDKTNFTPYKFFQSHLKAFGHAGHQSLAILTELELMIDSFDQKILENGKIAIILSPKWFSEGSGMNKSLWEKEVYSKIIQSRKKESSIIDKIMTDLLDYYYLLELPNNNESQFVKKIYPWKKLFTSGQSFEKN